MSQAKNIFDVTLITKVVHDRSLKDPEFRQRVQKDPKGAVQSLGFSIPEGVEFRTVSAPLNVVTLIVPEPPSGSGALNPGGEVHIETRSEDPNACGAVKTLTAECFCPDTATGRCFCP